MGKKILILFFVFLGALASFLYFNRSEKPTQQPPESIPSPLRHPVTTTEEAAPHVAPFMAEKPSRPIDSSGPLPPLESADKEAETWLDRLFPQGDEDGLFHQDRLIQRFTLLTHSLTEKKLAIDKMPFKPASGAFLVKTDGDRTYIDPKNYDRYAPYIRLAETLPVEAAARAYVRLYPLLQQAYEDLGVSSKSFHHRLLTAIDHLLETPEVKKEIPLTQPHVLYHYADPDLEALSSGQKILVRIGPKNTAVVKKKLAEFRKLLDE